VLHSQDEALASFFLLGFVESSTDGLIEHSLQALLRQSAALQILHSANGLGHLKRALLADHVQAFAGELRGRGLIVSQIGLGADEDDRHVGRVVLNLRVPLRLHVLERGRRDDGEAHQKAVRLRVRQRAQSVIVLLTCSVPQAEVDRLAVQHDVGAVVVGHSGNVLAGEGIRCVRNQQTCLTDSTITNDDALDVLHVELVEAEEAREE